MYGSGGHHFPSAHQPVVRSRTLLFLSYRDTRASTSNAYPPPLRSSPQGKTKGKGKGRAYGGDGGAGEEGVGLLDGEAGYANGKANGGHVRIDMNGAAGDGLPPKWVDYSDQVELILEGIKPKMSQLDRLTAKHVLPGFTDRSAEEREIERLTNDITRDFRSCQKHIRTISDFTKHMQLVIQRRSQPEAPSKDPKKRRRADDERYTERDVVLATNVQIALATKVQDLSSVFRKRQSNYLKQLKGYEVQTADLLAASGAGPIKEDPLAALEADESLGRSSLPAAAASSTSPALASSPRQQQALAASRTTTSTAIDDITTRDREITGIAQSITELADLFRDLGGMVIDQGTLLDRIDYNVERMAENVKGAVDELKVATHYQKRTGKCRLIFLLVLLIMGAVIILVYKPRRHSSPSPLPPADPVLAAPDRPGVEPVRGGDQDHDSGTTRRLAQGRGVFGGGAGQQVIGGYGRARRRKRRA